MAGSRRPHCSTPSRLNDGKGPLCPELGRIKSGGAVEGGGWRRVPYDEKIKKWPDQRPVGSSKGRRIDVDLGLREIGSGYAPRKAPVDLHQCHDHSGATAAYSVLVFQKDDIAIRFCPRLRRSEDAFHPQGWWKITLSAESKALTSPKPIPLQPAQKLN
jgi:hypothetical protein